MLVTRDPMRLPSSSGRMRLVYGLLLCWHSMILVLELWLVSIRWVHWKEWMMLVIGWKGRLRCGGTCRPTMRHSEWWLKFLGD